MVCWLTICLTFLSTLPARGATYMTSLYNAEVAISIHAPREGSDCSHLFSACGHKISIHAPREGSDRW